MELWKLGCLLALALAILSHPSLSPIQPVAYVAPEPPAWEGSWARNSKLKEIRKIFSGLVFGPEDILRDSQGNLYCSNEDGTVRKLWTNGSMTVVARFKGRPLGMEWLQKDKEIVVCEPAEGLLLLQTDGTYRVLSTGSEGVPLRFPNNVDVATDGRVYFSDVSNKFGYFNQSYELLEARPNGRLLRFDPSTNRTETLVKGLYFPNGVALSQNEDYVLIAESSRHRVRRYFLKGPKKGTLDVFMDNLPGVPDNINADDKGLFWITLYMPRQWILDFIHKFPALKVLLARLPTRVWQRFDHCGIVFAAAADGSVVHFLMDPDGSVAQKVTTARVFGDLVHVGFIEDPFIGTIALSDLTMTVQSNK